MPALTGRLSATGSAAVNLFMFWRIGCHLRASAAPSVE
jgi:hypothetical protein